MQELLQLLRNAPSVLPATSSHLSASNLSSSLLAQVPPAVESAQELGAASRLRQIEILHLIERERARHSLMSTAGALHAHLAQGARQSPPGSLYPLDPSSRGTSVDTHVLLALRQSQLMQQQALLNNPSSYSGLLGTVRPRSEDDTASARLPPEESKTVESQDSEKNNRQKRRKTKEAFPDKLYRLLNETSEGDERDVISWCEGGMAFKIHKPVDFALNIIPKYFKHKNLDSFRRQLNNYGFERVLTSGEDGVFACENFQKDKPELLPQIRRLERSTDPEEPKRWVPDFSKRSGEN